MAEVALCVCCLSKDDLLELFGGPADLLTEENYADILQSCFGLQLSQEDGYSSICCWCTAKLQETLHFKRAILQSVTKLSLYRKKEEIVLPSSVCEVMCYDNGSPEPFQLKEEPQEDVTAKTPIPKSKMAVQERKQNHLNPSTLAKSSEIQKTAKTRRRKHNPSRIPYNLHSRERRCRECEQDFQSYAELKAHYGVHFPAHTCSTCGKEYTSRKSLNIHQLTHKSGPFVCEQCQEEFKTVHSLNYHKQKKHRKEPIYKCNICGDRFNTHSQKLNHLEVHHGLNTRKHKCNVCDRSFRAKEGLKKHMDGHDTNMYSCLMCTYRGRRNSLIYHMRHKHAVNGNNRFVCRLCNGKFTMKSSLKVHVQTHVSRGDYTGAPEDLIVTNVEKNLGVFGLKK